ncbi:MAG: GyrI-like domain-containing protein [Bryobacteraceae bacterium]
MPAAEKIDLYKLHRAEYVTPRQPVLLDIQPAKYLCIAGTGRPGGEEFQAKVGALYSAAFTLKFESKFAGRDYAVCKLEGIYWTAEGGAGFTTLSLDQCHWDLIIRVPDFVDAALLKAARAKLAAKQVPHSDQLALKTLREGRCAQMLHVGPYDRETETIEKMRARALSEGFEFAATHHEIYLSDPRCVAPEKLRTILRIPLRKAKRV